jgi:streptomycin 6-kinase
VLKVVPADDDESAEEADALALWDGDGAVRLLREDRDRRALLLERAVPGHDLARLPEAEATAIAVDVAQRLWRPGGRRFRWIGDHVPRWLERAPGDLGASARALYSRLDVGRATLVHGDLHHHNILRSQRGWLAIDPKPMLGEPEFDVPPFLWNPLPCRLRVDHLESRLAAFAAAGLDEERIRAWTVIRGAYLQPQEAEALLALL